MLKLNIPQFNNEKIFNIFPSINLNAHNHWGRISQK